ncbi:MAG: helix-turn-helix domain-containing protein [Planctomycetes bacterium]|nr:helix-turn-helix domain-containing protein [Planctomycetota bacterium]
MDYVRRIRMELSRELLGTMLIKQVARRVGYNDYRSFSRQFKNRSGMSPREFTKLLA